MHNPTAALSQSAAAGRDDVSALVQSLYKL
jgi:hypothetical protein